MTRLLMVLAASCFVAEYLAVDASGQTDARIGQVNIELTGKVQVFRMLVFRQLGAAVHVGDRYYWLDYSRNPKINEQRITSLDGTEVLVRGTLEFRAIPIPLLPKQTCCGGGGPVVIANDQPVIVLESLEDVPQNNKQAIPDD